VLAVWWTKARIDKARAARLETDLEKNHSKNKWHLLDSGRRNKICPLQRWFQYTQVLILLCWTLYLWKITTLYHIGNDVSWYDLSGGYLSHSTVLGCGKGGPLPIGDLLSKTCGCNSMPILPLGQASPTAVLFAACREGKIVCERSTSLALLCVAWTFSPMSLTDKELWQFWECIKCLRFNAIDHIWLMWCLFVLQIVWMLRLFTEVSCLAIISVTIELPSREEGQRARFDWEETIFLWLWSENLSSINVHINIIMSNSWSSSPACVYLQRQIETCLQIVKFLALKLLFSSWWVFKEAVFPYEKSCKCLIHWSFSVPELEMFGCHLLSRTSLAFGDSYTYIQGTLG